MTRKPLKNLPQSIWTKLVSRAKTRGEEPSFTLLRYASERLLYRLSVSPHEPRFVLKGAMLFAAWTARPHRSTKDVDLLGLGSPDELAAMFKDVCSMDVFEDDAIRFDSERIRVDLIREDGEHDGRRVLIEGHLGAIPVSVQVDVGFGDAVSPGPVELEYPALIEELPAPKLKAYPPESVVAEKFEAMVKLGIANSRMKDFYDVWTLSHSCAFSLAPLRHAIRETFTRRGTLWRSSDPVALTPAFSGDHSKQVQWTAFLRRTRATEQPTLGEVVSRLQAFLGGISRSEESESARRSIWSIRDGAWVVP